MLLSKKLFLRLIITTILMFSFIVPTMVTAEPAMLTMLGAGINPDLAGIRFCARFDALLLPKGSSVISLGMLICPEQKLTGDLAFNSSGQLAAGIENVKAEGVLNFKTKKSFSEYDTIEYYATKSNLTINDIDTVFTARAYIVYKVGGKLMRNYSEMITRTYREVYQSAFPGTDVRIGNITVPGDTSNTASQDTSTTVSSTSSTDTVSSNTSSDTSSANTSSADTSSADTSTPVTPEPAYFRAMWVSQYDMASIYVSNGVQRSQSSYTSLVKTMIANIKHDGFNTILLQMRPFGDSMYLSQYFPLSRFVAGSYGGSINYDPMEIYIAEANAQGLSVHAWINPLRLMTKTEMSSVSSNYLIKQWYSAGSDKVVEVSGRLYLNPAYAEVRKLISDGAAEILNKYNVDGIHIDDYFYPTTDATFDAVSYAASGYTSLSAFRENNINLLVSGLYSTVHATDPNAQFGASPMGNLTYLRSDYYVDAAKWCSQDGYVDYILPQVYFGFLHGTCPFDVTVDKWVALVTNPNVKLYIGLSGGNAYAAYNGTTVSWAGTTEGQYEWINNKDVLKRSFEYILANNAIGGYCFFCYQYLYDPLTGAPTPNMAAEYANFIDVIT